eukprot:TRINITY_DN67174_c5_g9_i1.p2 TRINITY_DN67174_c5_g9~~TRINITY_DN67174_c5_g9_i1.p2  ORF type:complete len:1158 (-),score=814.64 TRINITY_DN67174_c5_g9_i1:52-3525(-)
MSIEHPESLADAKAKAFTVWVNHYLPGEEKIEDCRKDLVDGARLIHLLEFWEGAKKVGRGKHYEVKEIKKDKHKKNNMKLLLAFMKSKGFSVSKLSPDDLYSGKKPDVMMDLLWQIIMCYEVNDGKLLAQHSPATAIIYWCQQSLKNYPGVKITNLTDSFSNGIAMCAICDSLKPGTIGVKGLDPDFGSENLYLAFKAAARNFNVPWMLDAESMAEGHFDQDMVLLYLSMLRRYERENAEDVKAARQAYVQLHRADSDGALLEGVEDDDDDDDVLDDSDEEELDDDGDDDALENDDEMKLDHNEEFGFLDSDEEENQDTQAMNDDGTVNFEQSFNNERRLRQKLHSELRNVRRLTRETLANEMNKARGLMMTLYKQLNLAVHAKEQLEVANKKLREESDIYLIVMDQEKRARAAAENQVELERQRILQLSGDGDKERLEGLFDVENELIQERARADKEARNVQRMHRDLQQVKDEMKQMQQVVKQAELSQQGVEARIARERAKYEELEEELENERQASKRLKRRYDELQAQWESHQHEERDRMEHKMREASIQEDLIANSMMLPEIMMANTRLEMQVEELEEDNERYKAQVKALRKEAAKNADMIEEARKMTEAKLTEQVARTKKESHKLVSEARRQLTQLEVDKAKSLKQIEDEKKSALRQKSQYKQEIEAMRKNIRNMMSSVNTKLHSTKSEMNKEKLKLRNEKKETQIKLARAKKKKMAEERKAAKLARQQKRVAAKQQDLSAALRAKEKELRDANEEIRALKQQMSRMNLEHSRKLKAQEKELLALEVAKKKQWEKLTSSQKRQAVEQEAERKRMEKRQREWEQMLEADRRQLERIQEMSDKQRAELEKDIKKTTQEALRSMEAAQEEKVKRMTVEERMLFWRNEMRNKQQLLAEKNLAMLKRVRAVEKQRDEMTMLLQSTEKKLEKVNSSKKKALAKMDRARQQELQHIAEEREKLQLKNQEERKREAAELWRMIKRAKAELEYHKRKAAEEEKLRKKLESRNEARRTKMLERRKSLMQEKNRYSGNVYDPDHVLTDRSHRSSLVDEAAAADIMAAGEEQPTIGDLMEDWKDQHKDRPVEIYSTDQENIYIFGTRKIQLIVLNGQLMVRVGGGYGPIDKFVAKHAASEQRKIAMRLRKARERGESVDAIESF